MIMLKSQGQRNKKSKATRSCFRLCPWRTRIAMNRYARSCLRARHASRYLTLRRNWRITKRKESDKNQSKYISTTVKSMQIHIFKLKLYLSRTTYLEWRTLNQVWWATGFLTFFGSNKMTIVTVKCQKGIWGHFSKPSRLSFLLRLYSKIISRYSLLKLGKRSPFNAS